MRLRKHAHLTSAVRTALLMAGLVAPVALFGFMIGAEYGLVASLFLAVLASSVGYATIDELMLSSWGARKFKPSDTGLATTLRQLAEKAAIPTPALYVSESHEPNAFATGRTQATAAICVTQGLLSRLTRDELEAVLAHELAHIKNGDTVWMTIIAVIERALSTLGKPRGTFLGAAGALLADLIAPFVATLAKIAGLPQREFDADRTAAEICGHPMRLASALERIDRNQGKPNGPCSHPSTASRIARLKALAA